MSKNMTMQELKQHIERSVVQLQTLFSEWINSNDARMLKKAQLVAYWIKDYVFFLIKETTFSPRSVPKLKRGSVVVVDFGFRIGNEFGGRHFAVVLDNENGLNSPIVTVIPLFSLKDNFQQNRYTCLLDDGVYNQLFQNIKRTHDEALKIIDDITCGSNVHSCDTKKAQKLIEQTEKMLQEIGHMKQGSIANTCQITTISKIRIIRPLKKDDPLYGLRLSENDMEKINEQVKNLFVFRQNSDYTDYTKNKS